jgi:hypothetical protein
MAVSRHSGAGRKSEGDRRMNTGREAIQANIIKPYQSVNKMEQIKQKPIS